MECPICHIYAPPDPETGYDCDDICPSCVRDGWQECADGTMEKVDLITPIPDPEPEREEDYFDAF